MRPIFSTSGSICGSVPTSRKRGPCGYTSSQLSRSSPVRTEGLFGDALECGVHVSSTTQIKDPVPFMRIIRVDPTVGYYSSKPPSTPLYLMPIPSTYNTLKKSNNLQQIPKIKVTSKNSLRIVKKLLHSILNSVTLTVASNEFARNHFEIPINKKSYEQAHCDIAIQTQATNFVNRHYSSESEDYCSSSNSNGSREGPGAASEVRALRRSHVRLVLRQLRQLRDIDRLDRALRRPPPPAGSLT